MVRFDLSGDTRQAGVDHSYRSLVEFKRGKVSFRPYVNGFVMGKLHHCRLLATSLRLSWLDTGSGALCRSESTWVRLIQSLIESLSLSFCFSNFVETLEGSVSLQNSTSREVYSILLPRERKAISARFYQRAYRRWRGDTTASLSFRGTPFLSFRRKKASASE